MFKEVTVFKDPSPGHPKRQKKKLAPRQKQAAEVPRQPRRHSRAGPANPLQKKHLTAQNPLKVWGPKLSQRAQRSTKIQSRSKFSISIEIFNLARKSYLDLSISENFILAAHFQSRSFSLEISSYRYSFSLGAVWELITNIICKNFVSNGKVLARQSSRFPTCTQISKSRRKLAQAIRRWTLLLRPARLRPNFRDFAKRVAGMGTLPFVSFFGGGGPFSSVHYSVFSPVHYSVHSSVHFSVYSVFFVFPFVFPCFFSIYTRPIPGTNGTRAWDEPRSCLP